MILQRLEVFKMTDSEKLKLCQEANLILDQIEETIKFIVNSIKAKKREV